MTDTTVVNPTPAAAPAKTDAKAVQTPKVQKIESDAKAREADKAAIEAQVAEDTAVLEAAKADAVKAHDAKAKADAAAFDALNKAAEVVVPPAVDPTDAAAVKTHDEAVAANSALAQAAVTTRQDAEKAGKAVDKADAAVVAARDRLAESTAKLATVHPVTDKSPWYYCLGPAHRELKDPGRFFQSDDPGCPVCPQEKRQVSAVSVEGYGEYPPGILAVHERLTGGNV